MHQGVRLHMINQLLQRIAKRATQSTQQRHADSLVSSNLHSNALSRPFFPAGSNQSQARSATQPDRALAMWQQSKRAYKQFCADRAASSGTALDVYIPPMPQVFTDFGPAHNAVAALLWVQQPQVDQLLRTSHAVAVRGSEGIVAVYQALDQIVGVSRKASSASLHTLALRTQPNGSAAHLGADFSSTTAPMLLWFYAQTVPRAVDLLPDDLVCQSLQLRKFPAVAAQALEVRHLGLIHRFSAGAISFDQLLRQVDGDAAYCLCADLAALYLTGALCAAPTPGLPSA